MEGVASYRQSVHVASGGDVLATAYHEDAGASDRGDFRYTYFHHDELCAESPAGSGYSLAVEIYPSDDPANVQTGEVLGAPLACD
jgi:hypothetical protein